MATSGKMGGGPFVTDCYLGHDILQVVWPTVSLVAPYQGPTPYYCKAQLA